MTFVKFPKIPRLTRECIITEKIDGTNASVWILDDRVDHLPEAIDPLANWEHLQMFAGSRSRFLNLVIKGGDNAGFARWVQETDANAE